MLMGAEDEDAERVEDDLTNVSTVAGLDTGLRTVQRGKVKLANK